MVDVMRQKILDDKKWWQILVTIFYRNVPNVIEKSSFFNIPIKYQNLMNFISFFWKYNSWGGIGLFTRWIIQKPRGRNLTARS